MNEDAEQDVVERENRKNICISQEMEPYNQNWNYDKSTNTVIQEGEESTNTVIQEGEESTNTVIQEGEESTNTETWEGEKSTNTVIQEGEESTNTETWEGEESTNTETWESEESTNTVIGEGEESTNTVTWEGEESTNTETWEGEESTNTETWEGGESYPGSEGREGIEPDSLNCEAVSQNNEERSRYDDEDDEFDEDEFDDIAEDDAEFDEVSEDFQCDEMDEEDEHWYNGPGMYVWCPYSEHDENQGEYVWQPAEEKTKEVYWGNRNKLEEWIPQVIKEKKKKKKHWIPQLVARKEMGKTVWYYMLPSTIKSNNVQKQSLKHIPKLIKGKGSNRWFSQIVSTKDKKRKTVWYCKLTPIDTEQEGESSNIDAKTQMQAEYDSQTTAVKTIDDNPELAQQVHVGAESPLDENSKTLLQNSESYAWNSEIHEETSETGNSIMVSQVLEEQVTEIKNVKLSETDKIKVEVMKKPASQIPANSIPKLVQVQIWNTKPMEEEDQSSQAARAAREQPKGSWLPKLGKANKEKGSRQSQIVPNLNLQMENNDNQIENCLFQIPQMTMSLIEDEQPQQATAIWYEDALMG